MNYQFYACSRGNSDGIYRYYHFLKSKVDIIDIGSKVGVYESNIRYFRRLTAYLRDSSPEGTIFANGLKSALIINAINQILAKKFNVVYINHGLRYTQRFWFKSIFYLLEGMVNFFSNKTIFINKKEFNSVGKNKKYALLMHPVKNNIINREKKYDFIFIGRNDANKRPHLFLEYVSQFEGRQVILVGVGNLDISELNGINVRVLPSLENNVLQKFISETKYVVSTSVYETSPVIAIEAHEMGTIFISNKYRNDNYPLEELKSFFTFTDKNSFRELIQKIDKNYDFYLNEQSRVIKKNHFDIDLWCEKILQTT